MTKTQNTKKDAPKQEAPATKPIEKKKNNDLVVTARLKSVLHDASMNGSGELTAMLSGHIEGLLQTAIKNAQLGGRKTVRVGDFAAVNLLEATTGKETYSSDESNAALLTKTLAVAEAAAARATDNKRKKLLPCDA